MSQFNLQARATRDPDDGKANLGEWLRLDFTYADTGTDLQLLIPADAANPILLQNVVLVTTVAWGAGTLDIGDGSTADAYVDNTDITENSVDVAQSVGSANAKAQGEYLSAARLLTITVGGGPVAGEGILLAKILRL